MQFQVLAHPFQLHSQRHRGGEWREGVIFRCFLLAVFCCLPICAAGMDVREGKEPGKAYGPLPSADYEPWAYLAYVSIIDHEWLDEMKREHAGRLAAEEAAVKEAEKGAGEKTENAAAVMAEQAEEPDFFARIYAPEISVSVTPENVPETTPGNTPEMVLHPPLEERAGPISEDVTQAEKAAAEDAPFSFLENDPPMEHPDVPSHASPVSEDDQLSQPFSETAQAFTETVPVLETDTPVRTDTPQAAKNEDAASTATVDTAAAETRLTDIFTEGGAQVSDETPAGGSENNTVESKTSAAETETFAESHALQETLSSPEMRSAVKPEIVPLTEAEKILSSRLRRTLDIYRMISMATDENRPSDIMMFAIPFGCKVAVYDGCREAEEYINAIGALCWNYPMREQLTFNPAGDRLLPNLGYGVQRYQGQLLATFALSRVSANYTFPAHSSQTDIFLARTATSAEKLPRRSFTVMDLVEYEQKRCRQGTELSYALAGLSYYLPPDAVWKDADGNRWSLEKLLYHELNRPTNLGTADITNQLFGISCALRCRQQRVKMETSAVYLAAAKYLEDFREFALVHQNEWHCWHPRFFERKGISRQRDELFFASAHILRWLVMETPQEALSDPRIQSAVDILERFAFDHLTRWDPCVASAKELEGVMAALHAMTLYQRRYLEPRKTSAEASAKPAAASSPD